jgi:hypothetical protein
MFGTHSGAVTDEPNLLERAFAAGCTRLAVISLHPGAGARTVLERAAIEFHRRGIAVGVTRAPRLPLEALTPDAVTPIQVPEGTVVATTPDCGQVDALEPLGPAFGRTSLGDLGLFRVRRSTTLRIYGPDDADSMREALERLDEHSGGLALVDGAWERRAFAAPGGAQAVVLVAGAGYSGSPERSAAALRYVVEVLGLKQAGDSTLGAWSEAAAHGTPAALDALTGNTEALDARGDELASRLGSMSGKTLTVLLPGGLHDELLGPLSRSSIRCTLVVRDPTCVRVAPIYYRSWSRGGGKIRVIEPMRVMAVATNPVNRSGPDAEPERFRRLVSDTLSQLPTHDVVLEADRPTSGRFWSLLRRR